MDAEVFQDGTSPHSCAPCKPCDWHLCGCSLYFLSEAVHRYRLTALSTHSENLTASHAIACAKRLVPSLPHPTFTMKMAKPSGASQ